MNVPQAAIDAANEAILRAGTSDQPEALLILEAAAPHIAAAERERIRQLATDHHVQYVRECGDPDCPGPVAHMADEVIPFADLLTDTEGTNDD